MPCELPTCCHAVDEALTRKKVEWTRTGGNGAAEAVSDRDVEPSRAVVFASR